MNCALTRILVAESAPTATTETSRRTDFLMQWNGPSCSIPFTFALSLTSSLSRTSAPMESCQSAPALPWATMPPAASLSESISPSMRRALPSTFARTIPMRASVRFSWLVSSGTVSGISIPDRSTTTGLRQPGRLIFPPE